VDDGSPGDESDDGRNAVLRLLDQWCAARQAELGRVLRASQDAFVRNLRALSGARFTDATFDAEGNLSLREGGRGNQAWEQLDGNARDIAYLALRITLLQLDTRGDARALVLLDDPFEFEEPRLVAISRALRALTPGAQIVHLTSRPAHGKLADTKVDI
jgi:hypothetical protein